MSVPVPQLHTGVELAPRFARSALLTIDMQRDFLRGGALEVPGTTEVLPAVAAVARAFRGARRPVVHVVRLYRPDGSNVDLVRREAVRQGFRVVGPGSLGSQVAPGLLPPGAPELDHELLLSGGLQEIGEGEYAMFKPRWGAFYGTSLEAVLRGWGAGTLVVAGCNLPNCPRATIFEASERDFRLVAVTDAISQATAANMAELAAIGVNLLESSDVIAALAGKLSPQRVSQLLHRAQKAS